MKLQNRLCLHIRFHATFIVINQPVLILLIVYEKKSWYVWIQLISVINKKYENSF